MKDIELLSPAGNMESLYASVQAGADAVYIGGDKFSARAYAGNFDNESMRSAVVYCHTYAVKVYVTVNTVIKDSEFKDALSYAAFLEEVGVDGIIVQDIGFAYGVKKYLPDLKLHASTQMTVHNMEGALMLQSIGFDRIVLSRELSLEEIKYISTNIAAETEIFIHGALCVCYSGQCLMSSMIGGRSGNRGRCAQPCRLPYSIVRDSDKVSRRGYLLSPKDMCTIENIKDIIESGACSLKIEGRMKKPEYAAGVTLEYRKAVDSYKSYKNTEESKKRLMKLFNRQGFTKAYLFKNTGRDMMSYLYPKNTGIRLGRVSNDKEIILEDDISLGDGIRNDKSGFNVFRILKHNKEVKKAFIGEKVNLFPSNYKKGDMLYKTSDVEQMKQLKSIYDDPYNKKIELNLKIQFTVGKAIIVETSYLGRKFTVEGDIVQKAMKMPLDKVRIESSFCKTGKTPFVFSNIQFECFEEGFLPISALNSIRRSLLESVQKYILEKNKTSAGETADVFEIDKANSQISSAPFKMAVVSNREQLRAVLESKLEFICINPFMKKSKFSLEDIKNKKVYIVVPNIVKSEFEYICSYIQKNSDRIQGIITSNLGIINKFKGTMNIIGDYKLNITNENSLEFYDSFIDSACISVELSKNEIKKMLKNKKHPSQMLVYGRAQLMVSEYCVIGSTFGEKSSLKECKGACSDSKYLLVDRKNVGFPVEVDEFCRCYIYNSVPTNLLSNIEELKDAGVNSFRIDFTDETYEQTKSIIDAFLMEKWSGDFSGFTRGHYKKGIE